MQYPPQPQGPYPQQPPPAPKKSGLSTGCIVAIIAAVVLIVPAIGIVASLAIFGVRKYLAAAKTAEAKNTVGAIVRASAAAYERDAHKLCASSGPLAPGHGPVPADIKSVSGKKYQSQTPGLDYDTGTEHGGWKCLKFSMSMPQYYQYHYVAGGPWVTSNGAKAGPNGFEAAAKGDIDGNGVTSSFSRVGTVGPSGLVLEPEMFIENEFE